MTLQFKNAHIFFALESIWQNLNYKFKYHVNEIVAANPDDEYVQTIEVPEDILLQIFGAVTVQPEGVAAFINQEMLAELLPQVQSASNMEAVQAGEEQPNEGTRILMGIGEIDAANKTSRSSRILQGKTKILA